MHPRWKKRTIGEFCPLRYGKNLSKEVRRPSGRVPVYGSNGLIDYHTDALINNSGIIIGRKGTIGAVHYSKTPFWPIDTTFYIETSEEYKLKFVYYLFKTLNLNAMNSDSAVPGLNRDAVHNLHVFIPPIDEQESIVEILNALDDKIDLNLQMNEILEEMARAIFKSWFGDFDPVHAKANELKPEGLSPEIAALFPDKFEDSFLGQIPTGWSAKYLSDIVATLDTGARPKGGVAQYTQGIPSIGAENILGIGKYDYSKTKYVPLDFYNKSKRGKVKNGDVLLYKDGAQLGRKSYFDFDFPFEECCINEHVFALRTDNMNRQKYLYFWLDQDYMTEAIKNLNSNSAQPGINSTSLLQLPILDPPTNVLAAFETTIGPMIQKLFVNCKENRHLIELRDTLLPKLLSGEITIKNAEKQVSKTL